MWLQLPFQNGMATFCSLKIVAAMTKIARVSFSMQNLKINKDSSEKVSGPGQWIIGVLYERS